MDLDIPDHFGMPFAGQTLEWMPTDTLERFADLMRDPEHQAYFSSLGWERPGAITYAINSDGFRCAEFSDDPCIMALGCSFTFGTGLPLDTIWPELVGRSLGLRVANLAWGGYSADSCFRLAEYWIKKLQPRLVVMMAPPPGRWELMLDQDLLPPDQRPNLFEVIMPASQSKLVPDCSLTRHWFGNTENHRLNNLRNRLAVGGLCEQHGIAYMHDEILTVMCRSREEIGYARDYLHGGPPAHEIIAKWVLDEYQSQKPS